MRNGNTPNWFLVVLFAFLCCALLPGFIFARGFWGVELDFFPRYGMRETARGFLVSDCVMF